MQNLISRSEDISNLPLNTSRVLAGVLSAVVCISPFIEGGPTYLLLTATRLLLLAVFSLWAWNAVVAGSIKVRKTCLDLPIILFVLLAVTSTLFISPYKNISVQWVETIIGYAILFYATISSGNTEKERDRLLYAVMLMGLLEAGYGIVQHLSAGPERISGTFSNPNLFAGYLAAISALAASMMAFDKNRIKRVWLGAVLLLMMAAILISSSRGGVLSLAVAMSFVLWRRYRKWALCAIAGFAVVFLLVPNPLSKRMASLPQTDAYAYSRIDIWKGALSIIRDYPAGTGLGIYEYASRRYNFPNKAAIVYYGKYQENPHNEYLQVGAELGLLGLLVFVYGMLMLAREVRGAIKSDWAAQEKGVLVGMTGGIIAVFTQSMVDFNLHAPAIASLLVLFSGLLVASRHSKQGGESQIEFFFIPSRLHKVALLFLLLLTGIFITKSAAAYYISIYGDALRKNGEIGKAISAYEYSILLDSGATRYYKELATAFFARYKATGELHWAEEALGELEYGERLNPLNSDLPHKKAMIYRHLADRVTDNKIKLQLLQAVVTNYKRAGELDPYNPLNYYEIANVYTQLGDYAGAIERLNHIKDLEPNYLPGRLNLARAYRMASRNDLARKEYLDIITIRERFREIKSLNPSERLFLGVDEDQIKKELEVLQ